MNIQLENLKIKREMTSSKYFISAWLLVTDLTGIFNTDTRKTVSKFSGLRWFFLFKDSYNGEGSLQANKTSKNH